MVDMDRITISEQVLTQGDGNYTFFSVAGFSIKILGKWSINVEACDEASFQFEVRLSIDGAAVLLPKCICACTYICHMYLYVDLLRDIHTHSLTFEKKHPPAADTCLFLCRVSAGGGSGFAALHRFAGQ